ncbi:helix-turn-helix domain-containing protein [Roseibium sp. SCP14]|uniref:helix-turn-helix domain-containing protein n=1 Tax=Roseibium sp. SCP14 TaxID=3141375 RepID=UPI0033352BB3
MAAMDVSPDVVKSAQQGDRQALETVLEGVRDRVHNLARRILVNPEGNSIKGEGLSIAVLRRQADGSWKMVIDNPHGSRLLSASRL